jgi:hypothetical protein
MSLRRVILLMPKRAVMSVTLSAVDLAACLCVGPAQARPWAATPAVSVAHAAGAVHYSFANTDGYQASESVGNYPIVIGRDGTSRLARSGAPSRSGWPTLSRASPARRCR